MSSLGVYGDELYSSSPAGVGIGLVGLQWPIDGLHGGDVDRERGIVHRGQRHAMLDDGRWLQPEPLLMLGLLQRASGRSETLAHPGHFGPVYAGGNPVGLYDTSGFFAPLPPSPSPEVQLFLTVDEWTGGALTPSFVSSAAAPTPASVVAVPAALVLRAAAVEVFEAVTSAFTAQTAVDAAAVGVTLAAQPEDGAQAEGATETATQERGRERGKSTGDKGKAQDALDQLEEIEDAQRSSRRGKGDVKIDNIDKSAQRARTKLRRIRNIEDVEEEFDLE